jgi:hypothetical protein
MPATKIFVHMRRDIIDRREEIEFWVSQRLPKARICFELKCRPSTLDSYLKKFGLDYRGNVGGKGYKVSPYRKNVRDFLFNGSRITSHKLKLKLLTDGLKEKICERCRRREWLGEEIPLELHHINGDRFDNRFSNLQILCPNCHALTDNYSGRKTLRN